MLEDIDEVVLESVVGERKKIMRRATGARGYKFELFQSILLIYLGLSRSILDYLGLS